MKPDEAKFLQFLLGAIFGLMVQWSPSLALIKEQPLDTTRFLKKHPVAEWVPWGFSLVILIWVPMSIIAAAQIFAPADNHITIGLMFLIPLWGVGTLRSLWEICFNVSPSLGLRWPSSRRFQIGIIWPGHSIRMQYKFAWNTPLIRRAGLVRFAISSLMALAIWVWVY